MAIPSYTLDLVNFFSGSGSSSSDDGFEGFFKIMLMFSFSVLLLLEIIVAARTILFKGRYDFDLALHVFLDWGKGAIALLTCIASPLALKFWFCAIRDAFTVNYIPAKY